MMQHKKGLKGLCLYTMLLIFCAGCFYKAKDSAQNPTSVVKTKVEEITLPAPYSTKSAFKFANVIGWGDTSKPMAPKGFIVTRFASELKSPRWIYQGKNGDIFIAEANTEVKGLEKVGAEIIGANKAEDLQHSANNILLFRDADHDGTPEFKEVFLSNLHQPFGMLILGDYFYVATVDALYRYPYKQGVTSLKTVPEKLVDFPTKGENRHWTRNLIAHPNENKIYIAIGSGTNIADEGIENEKRRACILEINPDGSGEKIYAYGLRNPVGMGWAPGTNTLWTAVNERDELGDDLVPDFLTSVKQGGFYGWPYSYFGKHLDPRIKEQRPDLVAQAILPDVSLGAHTASLGLAFYTGKKFPEKYHEGVFIGQHGSWNRSVPSGYKVIFIPFKQGKPVGPQEDFLTGFMINQNKNLVHGRPVGVTQLIDGSLLVADDAGHAVWHIAYK